MAVTKAATRVILTDDLSNPNRDEVLTGTAGDAESAEITFGSFVNQVEIMAFENALLVRLYAVDGTSGDQFTVPRNGARISSFAARGFTVQNKTAGQNSDYEVRGLHKE